MIDVCDPSASSSVRAVLTPFVKFDTGAVRENVRGHCGNFSSVLHFLMSDCRTSIAVCFDRSACSISSIER